MLNLKKILSYALAFIGLAVMTAQADDNAPLWMRYSAISPDGTTIAFTYQGNIFTVPVEGGRALQITTNQSYDTQPIWSPDGSKIAFASYRLGSADIFVVSKDGGAPTRVTTNSANEFPIVFKDNNTILYSAYILPDAESMQFPSSTFSQVYQVSIDGGRPTMFSSLPKLSKCAVPIVVRIPYFGLTNLQSPAISPFT